MRKGIYVNESNGRNGILSIECGCEVGIESLGVLHSCKGDINSDFPAKYLWLTFDINSEEIFLVHVTEYEHRRMVEAERHPTAPQPQMLHTRHRISNKRKITFAFDRCSPRKLFATTLVPRFYTPLA